MTARTSTSGLTPLLDLIDALHDRMRRRSNARATAAREQLHEYQRDGRERYFAAASDAADLERRQRGWERAEPHAWP